MPENLLPNPKGPIYVIDNSFLVDYLVNENRPELPPEPGTWIAPDLLQLEFISALRSLILSGAMTEEESLNLLDDFFGISLILFPTTKEQLLRCLTLSHRFTVYDAAYVVLAREMNATLVTHDLRLAREAEKLVEVFTGE